MAFAFSFRDGQHQTKQLPLGLAASTTLKSSAISNCLLK